MPSIVRAVRGAGLALAFAVMACGASTDPGSSGGINPGIVGVGGGGGGGGGGSASGPTVTVSNNMFTPDNLTIAVGATVTFKWDSCSNDGYGYSSCAKHTVTFSDGQTSDTLSSGSFSRSFSAAGTYTYRCAVHGTYMSGTIIAK
jgi:plastocyanin